MWQLFMEYTTTELIFTNMIMNMRLFQAIINIICDVLTYTLSIYTSMETREQF